MTVTTFDLRRVKLRSGEQFRTTLSVLLEPFELGGQRYRPVPDSPDAELILTKTPQGHVLDLGFELRLEGPCVRCLEVAGIDVAVSAREYHESAAESEELRTPYLVDDRLDLSTWARDAVALALPDKILCREDCAGICAGCGVNRNEEDCRCPPPRPDARWAKLEELRERLQG